MGQPDFSVRNLERGDSYDCLILGSKKDIGRKEYYMKTKYKTTNELPFSLCADDVAGALGISRAGAYTLIKSKGFPRLKIGGRCIIPKDKFLEWINQNSMGDSEKWIM